MSETEKAYIAGLLDGEGSISIGKKKSGGKERTDRYHRLVVNISNTNHNVLEWVQAVTGLGSIYKAGSFQHRGHFGIATKPCYQWSVSGPKAHQVLDWAYPYLIIKKPQADIAKRFHSTFASKRTYCIRVPSDSHPGSKAMLDPRFLEERNQCHVLMRQTNGRRCRV